MLITPKFVIYENDENGDLKKKYIPVSHKKKDEEDEDKQSEEGE